MDTKSEWRDEDIVLVSALEHYGYCPRQCALIHVEQVFDDNVFTLRGRFAHTQVEEVESRTEEGVRVERSLPIWCDRLGIRGKADIVEFLSDGTPYPVEYKHGPRRRHLHDNLQLCGQALCLEEMFGKTVPRGAIYHCSSRRRREVEVTEELRQATEEAIVAVREMLRSGTTPPPADDRRCRNCSLADACMPHTLAAIKRGDWEEDVFRVSDGGGEP
jgi:CRISPR-associated exonuclease Cas4